MTNTDVPDWVRELHSPLDEKLGMIYTQVSAERTAGHAPVAGNTQPAGLWHGGATCLMAESLASIAAWAHARELGMMAVGVDLNATHHRSVTSGRVHGCATALHLGRSSASYEVVFTDDDGRRVATARLTCFLRPMADAAASGG